jgi:hypothetical protein
MYLSHRIGRYHTHHHHTHAPRASPHASSKSPPAAAVLSLFTPLLVHRKLIPSQTHTRSPFFRSRGTRCSFCIRIDSNELEKRRELGFHSLFPRHLDERAGWSRWFFITVTKLSSSTRWLSHSPGVKLVQRNTLTQLLRVPLRKGLCVLRM